MDKGLTVPKRLLMNRPKVPQMPQNLSAHIVCPSPKNKYLDEKRLHWASVVRDGTLAVDLFQVCTLLIQWYCVNFFTNKRKLSYFFKSKAFKKLSKIIQKCSKQSSKILSKNHQKLSKNFVQNFFKIIAPKIV